MGFRSGNSSDPFDLDDLVRTSLAQYSRPAGANLSSPSVISNQQQRKYGQYQHIAKLNDGLHVLHASNSAGGSGTLQSLMLIRVSTRSAHADDGKKSCRVIMEQAGEPPLGDRISDSRKSKFFYLCLYRHVPVFFHWAG
jgi:hypothetical protein